MAKNDHISQYLDYYLGLQTSPEFAVLLTGEWGSGKTWFLKNYLESHGTDHLYVSLNGVSSFSEIEDQFFRQLHPVLASKPMKFASKLIKGIIKTTVHIDLDGNGKPDLNVGSGIPDINLPEFLTKINNKALVFDDLERCAMSIPNILGYINQFVEGNGLRVIVVANEEEIIKSDDEKSQLSKAFILIKEKLIGRTFKITSDPETALDDFIDHVGSQNAKELVNKHKAAIMETYKAASYENLRHLRQAVLDFDRFYEFLSSEVNHNEDLADHLIRLFFALAIELRKGHVNEKDLPELLDPFQRSSANALSKVRVAKVKHSVFTALSPISADDWIQFFKTGSADKARIKETILKSNHFEQENTPDWRKLWHYFDLEDADFDALLIRTFESFRQKAISDRYEIIHLTGIFLELVRQRLLDSSKEQILQLGRENLLECKAKGGLKLENPHDDYPSTYGYQFSYHSGEDPEFIDFLKYARNLSVEHLAESSQREAQKLLTILKKSVLEFGALTNLTHIESSTYFNVPVLHHIPAKDFISTYFELPQKSKRDLAQIIEKRYQLKEYIHLLEAELDWLESIREIGNEQKTDGIRSLSKTLFENSFLTAIEKSIDRLNRVARSQ
jgi:hypothetical protein